MSWSRRRKFCSRKCSTQYYKINYSGRNSRNYGIKKSPLTRQRMCQAKIGSNNPMFGKESWNKSKPQPKQTRLKISQTKKELLKKGIIIPWNKGKKTGQAWNKGLTKNTDSTVAEMARKISEVKKKMFKNPISKESFRERSSESHKKYYKNNPVALEKLKEIRSKIIYPRIDTKIEQALQNALKKKDVLFTTQHPFYNNECETRMDIAIPNKKIAIYCDGDYWHNLPNYKQRDQKINLALQNAGWKVLRFWESEINSNVENCIKKIEEVLRK